VAAKDLQMTTRDILTTNVPSKKTLCWRGETFRKISIPFEAVVGLSGEALVRVSQRGK
jgi:hypothetical protein